MRLILVILLHIFTDIVICNLGSHSRVDWVQILSLAQRLLMRFWPTLRTSLIAIYGLRILEIVEHFHLLGLTKQQS